MALFALGVGMGIPLIIIGTYAGKILPKAGAWMNFTKVFFGTRAPGCGGMAIRAHPVADGYFHSMVVAGDSSCYATAVEKYWRGAGLLAATYCILLWVGISINQPEALRPLLCNVAIACKEQLSLTLKFNKIGTSIRFLKRHFLKALEIVPMSAKASDKASKILDFSF